jgi:hypothetical protein
VTSVPYLFVRKWPKSSFTGGRSLCQLKPLIWGPPPGFQIGEVRRTIRARRVALDKLGNGTPSSYPLVTLVRTLYFECKTEFGCDACNAQHGLGPISSSGNAASVRRAAATLGRWLAVLWPAICAVNW